MKTLHFHVQHESHRSPKGNWVEITDRRCIENFTKCWNRKPCAFHNEAIWLCQRTNLTKSLRVEALEYVIYSTTPPYTRTLWALPSPTAENSTLNEGCWDPNPWSFVTLVFDTMSRNQLNQKLMLMVKAPKYVIYYKILELEIGFDVPRLWGERGARGRV